MRIVRPVMLAGLLCAAIHPAEARRGRAWSVSVGTPSAVRDGAGEHARSIPAEGGGVVDRAAVPDRLPLRPTLAPGQYAAPSGTEAPRAEGAAQTAAGQPQSPAPWCGNGRGAGGFCILN